MIGLIMLTILIALISFKFGVDLFAEQLFQQNRINPVEYKYIKSFEYVFTLIKNKFKKDDK
jgi:hypothetical protein